MREFFKGWRRKMGCVALVMACAMCSAWLRSYSRQDRVDGVIAARLVHGYLVSKNGDLNIIRRFPLPPAHAINSLHLKKWVSLQTETLDPISTVLLGRRPAGTQVDSETEEIVDCWSEFIVAWRFDFAGFHCGQGRHKSWESWDVQLWTFPYWSLVIPITLFSACLILWKPRKKQPQVTVGDRTRL